MKAIQLAFQRSVAASASQPESGRQALTSHLGQISANETFANLQSTVPESATGTNFEPPLPHAIPAESKDAVARPVKMSSQGSLLQDTQPVSQSYYETIINENKSLRRNIGREAETDPQEHEVDTRVREASLQEGETGHIDLLSSYKAQEVDADDGEESEPVSFSPSPTQTQRRLSHYPESQRFKTPATVGKKRDCQGDVIEMPSLPWNPLARSAGPTPGKVMGLSQAFAATQAVSSPVGNGLPVNPLSDRPSPNIDLEARLVPASLSSPLRPSFDLRRPVTEPQSAYRTVEASQAERERQEKYARLQNFAGMEENPEEDSDEEPSFVQRQREHRLRKKAAKEEITSLFSPARPQSRGVGGPHSSPTRRPPASSPHESPYSFPNAVQVQEGPCKDSVDHNHEIEAIDLPNDSEQETEQENDVEVAVQRSSQLPLHNEEDKENAGVHGLGIPETLARNTTVQIVPTEVDSSPSTRHVTSATRSRRNSPEVNGTEPFAVADSQPSQSARKIAGSNKSVLPSSGQGTSVIPQSQVAPSQTDPLRSPIKGSDSKVPTVLEAVAAPVETEMSKAVQSVVEQPAKRATGMDLEERNMANCTIPETRLSVQAASKTSASVQSSSTTRQVEPTRSSTEFETAQTRLSTTVSQPVLPQQPVKNSSIFESPSGRKRRTMKDIAADPSPHDLAADTDMDAVMATVKDNEYQQIIGSSSPIPPGRRLKRRRLNQTQPALQSAPEEFDLPQENRQALSDGDSTHENEVQWHSEDVDEVAAVAEHNSIQNPPMARKTRRAARASDWDLPISPEKRRVLQTKAQKLASKKPASTMSAPKPKTSQTTAAPQAATQHQTRRGRRSGDLPPAEKTGPNPLAQSSSGISGISVACVSETNGEIVAPNQVFACFNGKTRAYYPATCIGITGADSLRYKIQWEGCEPDDVDPYGVRKLDIRVGDAIKINLDTFPKVTHVVRGLKDRLNVEDGHTLPVTDVRGHKTILVAPKQRKSLPVDFVPETVREIPVSAIYLDSNMWHQMKGREFEYTAPQLAQQTEPGFSTPAERPSTPSTPSSRSRRIAASNAALVEHPVVGMFSGMAFAISYDDDSRKTALTHLVQSNGGTVLYDGFHEVFDPITCEVRPGKTDMGFTALLADKHSRKQKYMQAIALSLPCLSGSWIKACIGKERIADWKPYLLPAGETDLLDGAARSRIMPAYPEATSARFADMVEMRTNLLIGTDVVWLNARGKVEERRRAYYFLLQVAGAGSIEKVADLNVAKELLNGENGKSFSWVFVDDRDMKAAKGALEKLSDKERCVRVVDKEFLCQSLILGSLLD